MKDDLSIPDFLARTETEDQAEARRKKNSKKSTKDGPTMGVVQLSTIKKTGTLDAKTNLKAQATVDKLLAEHHGKKAAPKKAGKLVERAMKARDELAKSASQKSASKPKVTEKKAAKSAPKPKGKTVGGVASEAILAGDDNEQALKKVMKAFPDCSSNVGCMAWYRNKLRKEGKLKVPQKAARR